MADVIEFAGACRNCGEQIIVCPGRSEPTAPCTHESCDGFTHTDLFHGCDLGISAGTVAAPRLRQMQQEAGHD